METSTQSFSQKSEKLFALIDKISEKRGLNLPPLVSLEQLKTLPPDSLGGNLANFLEKESLAPLVTGPRRKQLHDVVHVLTGYGTDLVGEAEVQAFLLGAKFHPLNLFLGLGLLRAIRRNRVLSPSKLRPRLWQAYQQGRKSRLDVDRWEPELKWALPLSEIQAQLNLQGIG